MKRILFVDDEPMILSGLRRIVMCLTGDWEAEFASSGPEAMELMKKQPFDVVISDMRMPGMDGADVMKETMRLNPQSVRIILSGQSDQDAILRCVGVTHQFLTKPCNADLLQATVSRACSLRDMLNNSQIKAVVSQITSLPAMPTLYMEIVKELQSPNASMLAVSKIISKDAGMLAKTLQMVNSAFFGSQRSDKQITDPFRAVNVLGLNTISALVLSAKVFSKFPVGSISAFSIDKIMKHSLVVGATAQLIAKTEKQSSIVSDNCFAAGVMHDLGKMILATNMPTEYGRVLAQAMKKKQPLWMAERENIGTTHAEIGAYLLGLWGLPDDVVEAVAYHHTPDRCKHIGFCPMTAVHIADAFDNETNAVDSKIPPAIMSQDYINNLKLDGRIKAWREALCENGRKAA